MQENTGPKTKKTDAAKLKKSLKHNFSFANWGEATERWLKGVRKRYTTLFLEVSKQARILAGVKVKPTDSGTESLGSVSGLDSSGRDLDSDYEGLGNLNHRLKNNLDGNRDGMGAGNHQESGSDKDDDGNDHDNDGHGNQQSGNEAGYQQEANDEDGGVEGSNDEDGGVKGSDDAKQGKVAGDDDYEMLEDHNSKTREPGPTEPELSALSDIYTTDA